MPDLPLTRRRANPGGLESWMIYYGDVRIGVIGLRAGVPDHVDPWGWTCGFYPGLHPGQHRTGSAPTFEAAREAFEAAWRQLLPGVSEGAFAEWRADRDWRAEMAAKRARGERLPSEIPTSLMRCVCGTTFDSWNPAESLPHRQHITEAQSEGGAR